MSRLLQISAFLILSSVLCLKAQTDGEPAAASSMLSGGKWFRMAVLRDGIYRIDYSTLQETGLEDPSDPEIFACNKGQLSFYNDGSAPDDLSQIAIYKETGNDGVFNTGDYILFFGQGPDRWKYDPYTQNYIFKKHDYSDTAFYFLTSGKGVSLTINPIEYPSGSVSYWSSESDALFVREINNENLIKSGREWYEPVSSLSGVEINPGFEDLADGEKMKYRIRVLARSPVTSLFRFYEGTTLQKSIQVQNVNMLNYTGTWAQITDSSGYFYPLSSSPLFSLKFFNNGEPGARSWLDFIQLHARIDNAYRGQTRFYSDSRSVASGQITEFSFSSPSHDPVIWDVTNPELPGIMMYQKTGGNISFRAETDTLRKFVFFTGSDHLSPLFLSGELPNQDLHGSEAVDMIIVTHPLFRQHAEELADIHFSNSGLLSLVITPREIYNEFSGGIPDISAIRNFIRYKFLRQKGTNKPLRYLLLFGDGSYENRTPPPRNPCFIPTYQSKISNIVVSSFTSDDFFGLLEDGEGEAEGTEDIGIGRLPVADTVQAGILVRKIRDYMLYGSKGNWKNIICISADDEDGNAHMLDAEGLASLLQDSVPQFNIDKIYLDAFRQVTSANGQSYPEARNAINDRINDGCLIFNYVGHGSETGLAHERVMRTEDILGWKNGSRLPLFITATCEFSRFDDMDKNIITGDMTGKTSAGEMALLNPDGGAIALMSTTRIVYSAPNYFLNRNIYDAAFDSGAGGEPLRMGDIIRIAKNNSGSGPNKRNFSLLGDPAVRLAYPRNGNIVTDSVNSVAVTEGIDSLKALAKITISGHIEDDAGIEAGDFNGVLVTTVYDKASQVTTLANDGGTTMKFNLHNNIIFNGKTIAEKGRFRFSFIVPRDIDYKYGNARISYYAWDPENESGGYFSDIVAGGFANTIVTDSTGPAIRLFMNDTLFRNGGITGADPSLYAILEDPGGINTTGSGIGHDITAVLDNNQNSFMVLNNYFESDFDSYTRGSILYNINGLAKGNHSLRLKAWDNYNNSSEELIHFVVESDGSFILTNLINYPNPATESTKISAGHNRPDEMLMITIAIFDGTGRLVRILETTGFASGYQLYPVTWDGKNSRGSRVEKGIYLYRVSVSTGNGEKAEASGRMIIL
ncbi:MAG TPA: type IX secretion system sortase PorU [Bacteroidales bacterium]|nr:type IX secretion system sortase PorU [Bacteroidales bacterium]HPJ59167.1 type IX secretion system sortase PorU [Bacteroidales bacterium]HPR12779.1 type IX secretion system sortase PorU [Bacteroidales bacterium]HRW84383.1 type IX secretion system sortase PorU [Bacteroidales bacterium]